MAEIKNKSNNIFPLSNVKSKYIIIQITDLLCTKNLLNIFRHNKNYQKMFNKNINDYKLFHNKIEIEITPLENKFVFFINISNKDPNYHFYLNDNSEELNRNYITKYDNAKKIKIIIDEEIKSLSSLFKSCLYIKKINFIKLYRKDIIDMSHMFSGCSSLEEINITRIRTDNVQNM